MTSVVRRSKNVGHKLSRCVQISVAKEYADNMEKSDGTKEMI